MPAGVLRLLYRALPARAARGVHPALSLHILPAGFVRIRHSGWLAGAQRRQKLVVCRELPGYEDVNDGIVQIRRRSVSGALRNLEAHPEVDHAESLAGLRIAGCATTL